MEPQQQQQPGRGSGQSRAQARPHVGAHVLYTAQGGDALVRQRSYPATITSVNDDLHDATLTVFAPAGQLSIIARFSPVAEPGCWSWNLADTETAPQPAAG